MAQALRQRIGQAARNQVGRLIQGPWGNPGTGKDPDRLLDDYIGANDTQRLHLYLQHRDLRPAFNAVSDLDDAADPALLRLELRAE